MHVQGNVTRTNGSGTCDFFEKFFLLRISNGCNSSASGPIFTIFELSTALFQRRIRINRFQNQISSCLDDISILSAFLGDFSGF